MTHTNPRSTARVAGHPIHPMLIPFPIVLFLATLVCDLVYVANGEPGWARAAMWLLGAGLIGAALAAVAGMADFLGDRAVRVHRAAWLHMIGNVMAVALEVVGFYLRYTQGAEAVVPVGVTISVVVALMLAFTGWLGGDLVYRHRVGVADPDEAP